jgi:hypothetical protein
LVRIRSACCLPVATKQGLFLPSKRMSPARTAEYSRSTESEQFAPSFVGSPQCQQSNHHFRLCHGKVCFTDPSIPKGYLINARSLLRTFGSTLTQTRHVLGSITYELDRGASPPPPHSPRPPRRLLDAASNVEAAAVLESDGDGRFPSPRGKVAEN